MALGIGAPMLIGADVSQYQNDLGANDLDFVIVKATQGTGFQDPHFLMHVQTSAARGQLVMAYHFAERNEGSGGAENFLRTIAPVQHLLCRVACDVEFQDEATKVGPTYDDVVAWNQTVASRISLPRMIYTAQYYWGGVLGNPPAPAGCDLWWANLVPNQTPDPGSVAAQVTKPPLPDLPWSDYAIRQVGWQQTVGGVSPIDIDISYLTRDQLAGTEDDLTPEQDARLTACCKLLIAITGVVDKMATDEATRARLEIHGDPTHYGLNMLKDDVNELKKLLPAKAVS